ncbi:transcription factor TFIIIB component B'' homolog [Enhydra lutris kenyoni]|uniref:Transcription factor TFIIIB component B'' homolog n=1 Tax=Enhydra lutris kenyoni TaxID=391180 RepID=A0A2Y9KBF4_ENHLU|nr:transcription factor TFIIIB component B'' homolog [Enhydra lutris kenyoni]
MFRRARLSVKPNVRPGVGARGSTAPNPPRGQEAPRPQDPAAASSPKLAESTDVPPVDCGGSEPQEKAPRSSDEKTDSENYVEESSKSSSTVSQRRKRISSTPTLVKPGVTVPSESHPLSTVNQEVAQPNPVSTKEKQPCSDRYRLYKAQKLREILKEELRKEKKQWKNKYAINESQKPPDRSKMTMRDFIYYLPDNNPMTSSLEQEKKTEKSLTPVQTREQEGKSTPDTADNEELEEEVDDGPLLVPRVKVAEDGSIILDEESLTVEVLRTKGPCVVEENDPIFERGSTTTYSSFRKNYYSKPWSNKETDMFFLAISMVGTDFSMIGQLFPHRARIEIKNKFKREEKTNGWRIDKAFQEKRPFDFDFFAHLLQKVLAEEEKRKQKSVKNQSLKEKKSSKPRKNVKVKKVASEGGNDDPDVSPSTRISDTEPSQKDAQIVEEEQHSQTLTAQDSEQIALETDLNQKKRRRKNQDEVGQQEVKNLSENATVPLGHSKGETYENKGQSLREINEDEVNKEQKLSCIQNMDDIVHLSSSEKAEKRTDPILSSSGQQDTTSLGTEASESSPSGLPLSEAGISALCEVNNVERNYTEESSVDLKNKSLETDQSGNVKLMGRRQLQRPKPNLSRAVGKKSVLSQGKTDAKSKSLHAETSFEKNHMEKDKVNTLDISGMENIERENSEAETVSISGLSEKIGLQEDDQTKTVRPARLMRSRLQRPKPNVGKAAERKILASQEKIEANVKKNESESCVARDSPEQVEDQSCKNVDFEDITLQSEKEDNFFQMNVNECVSIQEDKKVPVLKTRFQKPKPNIGRGARRREIFSKKEVSEEIESGQFAAPLREITRMEETLPRESISVEANSTKEKESYLGKTESDKSPREKIPEMMSSTVEMEADWKEIGGEVSPRDTISEVSDITEERVKNLEETGREVSPRDTVSDVSDVTEERVINLEETNVSSEVLSVVQTPEEEEKSSEKELSGHLSCLETSLQTSEPDKTDDQGMLSPDVPELFSNTNLSKSLPQEQKPLEVKPAPFMRSRFKRPKPNLARATLKRETTEAEKYVRGKKLETDKTETVVVQQTSEQVNTLPSQHGVASLMTSREKDKSGHREEETVIFPCIQPEKDLSPSSSCNPEAMSQPVQTQEKELVVSMGSHRTNTFQQEVKESVIPTARIVRSRLQRPRPNITKAGPRQIEKGEAEGIIKEERTVVQKDETEKFLTVPSSPVGTEIEVVSSKVSEGITCENQSHMVLAEPLHLNKINVLDEKMRHEPKRSVPSPAHLVRRQFRKVKPNLGRAHGKKDEPGILKDRANEREARKPEDNLLQPRDSDTHLLQKEKAEFRTSLEVSARKDCVDSTEASLAKSSTHLEVGPSGSVGGKTVGDNSVSSVAEEQCLSKLSSSPQLLKESNYSKIGLDRRTTASSECEVDHGGRRIHRRMKPSVTRGRGSKRVRSKTSRKEPRASKATLVTLRASQEEDEDDDEDFEPDYEDESYHLAPEEVNKAPVFVPIGLRSPEPVSAQIEETMEELEITVNVPDIGIAVVEHPLSNTDVTTQEMRQEENLKALSVEMNTDEHTQDETGTSDGSTEAAITLLAMGDLVLQSEIGAEQSDGVCVLLDVHSKDKSCVPFSPDNVNHKIVRECQELSSPVNSTSPSSLEENKIVLEEQSTKEEIGLVEKVKENAVSTRNTTSEVTSNLRIRSRFAKPKPNLKTSGTSRFGVHQEVPNLFINKGEVVESQRETEKNISEATELQDENLGSLRTAESKEQSKLACEHGIGETAISQEANLTERNDDQEEESQKVQISSVAPVSFETRPHILGSDVVLPESSVEEPQGKDSKGDNVLALHMSEDTLTSMPEVQQENVISSQDLTVNLVANVHQDGEDEQAFILTLVEIPTNAVEEFSDTSAQLMPNPLLPAPILIKSVNTEERSDMSVSFPVTSVGLNTMCLSDPGKDDSEEPPPANLDLISRKRFHCMLEESDQVPPPKKSLLTSGDDCQNYTSEVCSKEMINASEETGESYKEQGIFPTSGSTHITPEPQKEQLEPAFQSIGSGSLDKITDTHIEKSTSQLPQDERIVSAKEEGTCAASKSEQMNSIASSSKTPLSRPGRRPLGFLSLICSKNSLESDEPTQVYNKKRLKPLIPVSRKNLKRSNPLSESQKKIQESSDQPPSPSVVDTQSENTGSSATQASCDRPLPKEECKSSQNRVPEEEPTTVSEYFFGDIFIEVDETE